MKIRAEDNLMSTSDRSEGGGKSPLRLDGTNLGESKVVLLDEGTQGRARVHSQSSGRIATIRNKNLKRGVMRVINRRMDGNRGPFLRSRDRTRTRRKKERVPR